MFFAGDMNVMANRKFPIFSRKIWWLREQSYLRRPFNKTVVHWSRKRVRAVEKIWIKFGAEKYLFIFALRLKKRQFLQVCLRPEKFDISSNNFGYLHKGSYLCNPNKKGGLVKPKRSLKVWKQQQHKTRFEFRFYGKVYSNQKITTCRLLISI